MTIKELQTQAHKQSVSKGFWGTIASQLGADSSLKQKRNKGELIALMHSELSECLEALRHDDKENEAEELADLLIRVGDYAEAFKINLTEAVEKKMAYNKKREYKHGKCF